MPTSENVIRIMCPNLTCKRILAVPDSARGKMVRCRGCGINLRIPNAKTVDSPAAPSSGDAKAGSSSKTASGPQASSGSKAA